MMRALKVGELMRTREHLSRDAALRFFKEANEMPDLRVVVRAVMKY